MFSKYLTLRSYSTYLHEKVFPDQTENVVSYVRIFFVAFSLTFFHQLILQEGIFGTAA